MNNSESNWGDLENKVNDIAVDIIWNQWACLSSMVNSTTDHESLRIIDPEALILASVAFKFSERRFSEILQWWAAVGTPLLSVQRMKSLANGQDEQKWLTEFAEMASRSGHRSWAKYATKQKVSTSEVQEWAMSLTGCPSLLLRLRAAFGVGAKADIIALLIGVSGMKVTVSTISTHLGYTKKAIRDALKEMSMAGLIRESSTRPATYSTDRKPWLNLLQPGDNGHRHHPKWVMWSAIFNFLYSAQRICSAAAEGSLNEHLAASQARELVEDHMLTFEDHDISVPDSREYLGIENERAFRKVVDNLEKWIRSGD